MSIPPRTPAQRLASVQNGRRGSGPRTPQGRARSALNRTVHGLNSVRLLLAGEDVQEYKANITEWLATLAPRSPGEHQLVQLIADLAWRLRRLQRIEERRALAVLEDLVEETPERRNKVAAEQAVLGIETVARMVTTSALPVPSVVLGGFLAGVRGVEQLLENLRDALAPERWPENAASAFLGAVKELAAEAVTEEHVSDTFSAVGAAAESLATAVRALLPELDAAIAKARAAIPTHTLLTDEEDKVFDRHRRLLEGAMARELDLFAKVKAMAAPAAASGSFEQAPAVELRVVTG